MDISSKKANFYIISACIMLAACAGYRINNDLWFMLATGREIVEGGGIFTKDVLSMHSNLDIIIHQWLYCVSVWGIYSLSGTYGVWLISIIIGIATVKLFFELAKLISGHNRYTLHITLVIAFLYMYNTVTRPYTISNFLLLAEVYALENFFLKKEIKYLYILPIISCLLANFHGAIWIFFIIFALPFVAEIIIKKTLSKEHGSLLYMIIIISIMAGLLNPYKYQIVMYPFIASSGGEYSSAVFISEMKPLDFYFDCFGYIALLFVGLFYGYLQGKINTNIRYVLLSLGTLILTFIHLRCYLYFLLLGCFPLVQLFKKTHMTDRLCSIFPYKLGFLLLFGVYFCNIIYNSLFLRNEEINFILVLSAFAIGIGVACKCQSRILTNRYANALICGVSFAVFITGSSFSINPSLPVETYKGAAESIIRCHEKTMEEDIILYTGYNDGNYFEFIGMNPYMDTRYEVFLKSFNHQKDYFDEFINLRKGLIDFDEFLKEYKFNYLVLTSEDALYHYLKKNNNYECIYGDSKYVVLHHVKEVVYV